MNRKSVLWLCSWYPNANDEFDGDFIQRQAIAAARFDDIDVIYIGADNSGKLQDSHERPLQGLNEYRYFVSTGSSLAGRAFHHFRWFRFYKKIVRKYFQIEGVPDLVHIHVPWKAGLLGLWMKKKYGLPYIVSEHWTVYDLTQPDNFNRWPLVRRELTKKVLRGAKDVVSVSRYLSAAIQNVTGVAVNQIIPNVVDTSKFYFQEAKNSVFTFIHVSNMAGFKNVNQIISAYVEARETMSNSTQLLLVGNPRQDSLQTAKAAGLLDSAIFFQGELPYGQVAEAVRRSHVFVLFSDTETFSCATAEALCSGVPVLARAVGAVPELVNETNGVLINDNKTSGLARAFREIYDNYANYNLEKISRDASERFNYVRVGECFHSLYHMH